MTARRIESPLGERVGRRPHLLVDVRRQPRHVLRIQGAADRIALSGDLDWNDATFVGHHGKNPELTVHG